MGIALSCIHLSYDDFCRLNFEEFEAIYNSYVEQRDTDFKDKWIRMRMLATITIQPHLDKNHKITPEKLLPFPWDKLKDRKDENLTIKQRRERLFKIVKKLGDTI